MCDFCCEVFRMFIWKFKVLFLLMFFVYLCLFVLLSDFYLYGLSEGDILFLLNDDSSFGEVGIFVFFFYFDCNYDLFYVSIRYIL